VTFYEIRRNDIMKMDAHWAVYQAESFVEALPRAGRLARF
jgi:hypothetical protein